MTATELLSNLQQHGFCLTPLPGGKLEVTPASKLTDALREELKKRKAEILALLNTQLSDQHPSPDYGAIQRQIVGADLEDLANAGVWLADQHPTLWGRLCELDSALSRLERDKAPEAVYRAKLRELVDLCQEAKTLREGKWGALLVKSELLGVEVWVVREEEGLALVKGDTRPIFFVDEIPLLRAFSPEQLQDILKTKAVFPGCRVIQE